MLEIKFLESAEKILQQPFGDVAYVSRALAQLLIIDRFQTFGVFLRDLRECEFDVYFLFLDVKADFIEQRRVFEHKQMRIEDRRVLGAHSSADFFLHSQQLLASFSDGLFEAKDLLWGFVVRDRLTWDAVHSVIEQ